MAESIFDFVADELEQRTDLAKLEARGTVRLALKEAGLDARSVSPVQMVVMLEKVLPAEMRSRGIDSADQICQAIVSAMQNAHIETSAPSAESPEAIFRRLADG